MVTPHNAWASRAARQSAVDQLAEVIGVFVNGGVLNRVN
jgi:lactate dehydrogenase-like 2-hydroxyacid dehydrogenase